MQRTGSPDDPVDWSDPDTWIPEWLSDEDRKLAYAIWEGSNKSVNPRHTAGSWELVRKCVLLAEDPDGNLRLTDRGRDFIDHAFGSAEALVDEQEGLIGLLSIVGDKGPARSGVLVEPWAKFLLERDSPFRASSTIKDTLGRRLSNLRDRDLLQKEGLDYSITEAGLDYLKRVEPPETPMRSAGGLTTLTKSLEQGGLLFSQETVANYVLALQTKRFAILTGISGTGKTRIAKAVAEHFQPTVTRRVPTKIPDDAVEIEVRLSHLKHSLLTVPQVMVTRLSLLGPDAPLADRRIRIRYPGGETALTHYHRGSTELYLSGGFKKWYHSNLELGDRIWLRLLESDTLESDGLEMGLIETEFVEQRLDNYEVIPVRPDWVDNRGLLGYLNPLTNEYSTTPFLNLLLRARAEEKRAEAANENPHPFFVILDEMNLARVEHYFSDFLSALESGEDIPLHENEAIESGEAESGPQVPRKLKVPGNVLFTGTVNVDETTYMFSPKVLDRAFTIEFDQVDLKGFSEDTSGEDTSGLNLDGIQGSLDLLPSGGSEDDDWKPSREDWVEFSEETPGHHKALLKLHDILEAQHRHFGYRVANEIARFVNLAREQAEETDAAVDAAFDLALLQKVLPKFHGTQQELESLLEEIFQFAVHGGGHVPKKDRVVELDDWKVVKGRLVTRSKKTSTPSQTPSGDAGADGDEADGGTAEAADADNPKTANDAKSPAYPRTGAKVLRMLNRVRDRGFTSFIE